jgi:hypothetical protein
MMNNDTATTTTATLLTKDQVLSWLHNELSCVTSQRISQETSMTRAEASHWLKTIYEEQSPPATNNDDKQYRATICTVTTTSPEEEERMGYKTTGV